MIKFWEEVDARYVPAKDQGVDSEVEKYVQALKESKNVIFHGAPGTGKTFLAKMVAADIVSNGATTDLTTLSPDLQSHIGFVQFHPSYDYTDFVEGLRPVDGDNGQINIRWQPGVFYKFINAAREQKSNPEATFDASWDRLLELIDSKGFIIVPNALRGEFGVELNITGDGLATRTYQSEYGQGEWLSGKGRFYSHNQMYRVYRACLVYRRVAMIIIARRFSTT
ncbi:AAA family ATPase [Lacticaseibacillus camelliae]|uniref:nSTAND3 domain-containing NTPase n=1 Tax=Lacticaseibacillus camelliae TaxID=381742 RepID=UPI0006CF4E74|nr:AAA family ATPase [Lacticaseibacillus camelliae]